MCLFFPKMVDHFQNSFRLQKKKMAMDRYVFTPIFNQLVRQCVNWIEL